MSTPFSGHHNAWFLLNCRIPLVRSSSELVVPRTKESPKTFSGSWKNRRVESTTEAVVSSYPLNFVPETLRPNPQSQSLFRGYGSILPTSLIYIVLSTRGCTPWRPEAVVSTTGRANKSRYWVFTDRRKRTGQYKKILLCQSFNLIAGQSDSKVKRTVKKKRELFPGLSPMSPVSFVLPLIIHVPVREY